MRPRGDSVSSPVATNVGQCIRQSPQCTQRARSAIAGPSGPENAEGAAETPVTEAVFLSKCACGAVSIVHGRGSDSADEAAGVEHVVRVVHPLQAPHQLDVGPGNAPSVGYGHPGGRTLHDDGATIIAERLATSVQRTGNRRLAVCSPEACCNAKLGQGDQARRGSQNLTGTFKRANARLGAA